jgi:hypothetical protein
VTDYMSIWKSELHDPILEIDRWFSSIIVEISIDTIVMLVLDSDLLFD